MGCHTNAKHIRCVSTFICRGCACVWVLSIIAAFIGLAFESSQMSGYLKSGKPQHRSVVEAIQVAHTSMPNTYEVINNLHMLWMCACMSPYSIMAAFVGQGPMCWKFTTNSGYLQRGKKPQCSRSVVEAIDPFKWAPTSVPNTYNKLCFTTFICCGCAYEWVLTTTAHLVGLAFECSPEYVVPLEGQTTATCGDWGCIV